jgi:hypothetical protein
MDWPKIIRLSRVSAKQLRTFNLFSAARYVGDLRVRKIRYFRGYEIINVVAREARSQITSFKYEAAYILFARVAELSCLLLKKADFDVFKDLPVGVIFFITVCEAILFIKRYSALETRRPDSF